MKSKTRGFPPSFNTEGRRHFIQPLAVALVFLIFALLFFGMAMMDLGRLEDLLMDALRKKALYVVDVIEKASREKYGDLMREGEEFGDLSAGTVIEDQSFSLRESLVRALIDLARDIDLEEQTGDLGESGIRELAASEHLRAVGIFDENGGPEFQSDPIPPEIITRVEGMVRGGEEIAIHLFGRTKAPDSPRFAAIRRQNGKGAVAVVIDPRGIEYWGRRIAIQAAIEELQWGAGIAYLSVDDKEGGVLARFGNIPRETVEESLLKAGAGKEPGSAQGRFVEVGNTKFLQHALPFIWDERTIGTARVGLETLETDRLLVENRKHIFLWTGLMMLVGFFAMGTLYRTQNRHVTRIQAMRERLYQAERLSSLGKLGAGVAHEIRNPLNAISMAAQRLQRDFVPDESDKKEKFERITHIIRDEIRRLNKIVEDFLSLSRTSRMELLEQSVTGLLDRVLDLVREEAGPRDIEIEKKWTSTPIQVRMDAGKMQQAMLNIIRNAMESISGRGRITISCETHGKDQVNISIRDTGTGIAAGEEKRIFDPFYTSKEDGVGLGLAIAHEIVVAHGGEIRVKSESGKGSTFEVLLPRGGAAD